MCSFYVFQPERAAPGRHARGADDIVVFRSAKEPPIRGAKDDIRGRRPPT